LEVDRGLTYVYPERMSTTVTHEQRLRATGIELPDPVPSFGQYVPAIVDRSTMWVGGHFGTRSDGSIFVGRCGEDVSAVEARGIARAAAVNLVSTVRDTLGTLDRVARVAQVYGVVNSTSDFREHTSVIDAASDVLVEIFGDAGRHTRLAVGVASLPGHLVLEIQATLLLAE
jgi:enamine deaminase RidA (YjgF/YER057c/UK114 family)